MNVDLTHRILDALGKPASLIKPVADRPGHDRRYCLDTTKLRGARLGAAGAVRGGAARDRRVVPRTTSGGGGRSRSSDPAFRAYYAGAVRQRRELTSWPERSGSRDRRGRLRRQPSARASRRHRTTSSAGRDRRRRRRSRTSRGGSRRPARSRSRARGDRASCGRRRSTTAPARRTSPSRGATPPQPLAGNVLGTHHLLDALRRAGVRVPRARARVGARLRAVDRAASPRTRRSRRPARTPSASSRRSSSALRAVAEDGLDVIVARPFNHTGPRQTPGVRRAEHRAADRADRARRRSSR